MLSAGITTTTFVTTPRCWLLSHFTFPTTLYQTSSFLFLPKALGRNEQQGYGLTDSNMNKLPLCYSNSISCKSHCATQSLMGQHMNFCKLAPTPWNFKKKKITDGKTVFEVHLYHVKLLHWCMLHCAMPWVNTLALGKMWGGEETDLCSPKPIFTAKVPVSKVPNLSLLQDSLCSHLLCHVPRVSLFMYGINSPYFSDSIRTPVPRIS